MLQAIELNAMLGRSNVLVSAIEKTVDDVNRIIEQIKSDENRSSKWKEETIVITRDKFLPTISQQLNMIKEISDDAIASKPYWSSKAFLLSVQKFHKDPEKDALIRLSQSKNLSAMPKVLLDLTMRNARAEKNLPLIYEIWKVADKIADKSTLEGTADFTIGDVVIPDQETALSDIQKCWNNLGFANLLVENFFGRKTPPLHRLQIARQEQHTEATLNPQLSVIN